MHAKALNWPSHKNVQNVDARERNGLDVCQDGIGQDFLAK